MGWRLTIAFFLLAWGGTARGDWETVTVDGRDYVTLESLAQFYGMEPPAGTEAKFTVSGGGRSLAVRVGSRQALIDGVRQWLSYPAIAKGNAVLVSKVDVAKTIDPAYRPTAVKGMRAVKTVVLDPGHGGYDRGAKSSFGYEKDYTLDVVARVRRRLESAGLKVVQPRLSDSFVPLESRPAMAAKYPGAIFVSIHFNSADWNRAANGFEIYAIPPLGAPPTGQGTAQIRDRRREAGHALEPVNTVLANTIYHALLGKMPVFDRGVKRARFVVLKDAAVPAVLIEGGFLTNASEAANIASPRWREAYAEAIATGILEYKKLAEQGSAPRRISGYGRAATTEFVPED